MSQTPLPPEAHKTFRLGFDFVTYGAVALAVWLGWEIVKAPIAQRAPPELAVRLDSTSPEILRRAAEGELAAKRLDNAAFVARESIARAPINPQALRVLGLSLAETNPDQANQILTFAGNLSLRDSTTHAWLVQERLKRGDYGSAFAHADTLVRRRIEIAPQVFALYTTAATSDPRALGALIRLVATRPRWRQDFLEYLYDKEERTALLASLVIGLEPLEGRFTDTELRQLYGVWRRQNRIQGLHMMRERLNRPETSSILQNGDFEQPEAEQILPFGWTPGLGPGITASISDSGDSQRGRGLWIEYDGYASGVLVEQLVLLPVGTATVSGEWRADGDDPASRVAWSFVCAGTETPITTRSPALGAQWARFSFEIQTPAADCPVQALRLKGVPGDRRRPITLWMDNLRITPAGRQVRLASTDSRHD